MLNSKIIYICRQKFIYLNYSENTSKNYITHIERFVYSLNKQINHCNAKDFQNYFDTQTFTSISQQNQTINAIRFLYKHVLNKKYAKVSFVRPRSERKLPDVLDGDYIKSKLSVISNLKHKAVLSLVYSVGLRVNEVTKIKLTDIDSKRMIIHIRLAKGHKDRIVPLSEYVLNILRKYYKVYKPVEYLFNGQNSLQYSVGSCQRIFKKYIDSNGHIHTLRHSCFTNLLENGTNLRVIQKIAGHSSIKTTELYTHVSNKTLNSVRLPI